MAISIGEWPNSKRIASGSSVFAMMDAGFSARYGGGSAVVFEREQEDIPIEKPHTVGKVGLVLCAMGKRMRAWFS